MRLLLLALIVVQSLHALNPINDRMLQREWESMDENQRRALLHDFKIGFNDDLGWTLMSINWQESQGCKYRMNLTPNKNEMVFGCHHNLLHSYMKRNRIKSTPFNRVTAAQTLMEDQFTSAQAALAELRYWKKRRDGNWRQMIASYFAGNAWSVNGGPQYATNILKRIKFLKRKFHRAKAEEARLEYEAQSYIAKR